MIAFSPRLDVEMEPGRVAASRWARALELGVLEPRNFVVIGERGLKDGTIEVKWRTDEAAHFVPAATAGDAILAEIEKARNAHQTHCEERKAARAGAKRS